ncbi:protein SCO1 homolog 2, mitochondrial-like [Hibiscus syriacus]|uniref:protein SCO1 homolog 2, mitochondrial-like n=1 Tax=Hibiscus syriacus TaxID=106335 RepID=UPI0019219C52|nr:protein SCO1 homolog 2, mitochondrial-like [Hibiscus syriacus]
MVAVLAAHLVKYETLMFPSQLGLLSGEACLLGWASSGNHRWAFAPKSNSPKYFPKSVICPFLASFSFPPSTAPSVLLLFSQGTEYNTGSSDTAAAPIIGGPFTLVNTEKRVVKEREFLGNWVSLYFGYTSSPDIGPDQVQIMVKAIDTLESKENLKVLLIFVTIDPQRDGPAQLRAYLNEFDPRIVGLTGPVSAVRQMVLEYRVYFKKVEEEGDDYLVESSHNMYLIDPKMKVVRCFGVEYNSEQLSKEISEEMKKHQVKAE